MSKRTRRSYTPMLDQTVSMTVVGDTPVTYFYNADERQSVKNLTDATGTAVQGYECEPHWQIFTAYGERLTASMLLTIHHSSRPNRYTYTGRESSAVSGDYYFRNRTYGAAIGGFLTRDPLGYVDGMSVYNGYFAGGFGIDPWGWGAKTWWNPRYGWQQIGKGVVWTGEKVWGGINAVIFGDQSEPFNIASNEKTAKIYERTHKEHLSVLKGISIHKMIKEHRKKEGCLSWTGDSQWINIEKKYSYEETFKDKPTEWTEWNWSLLPPFLWKRRHYGTYTGVITISINVTLSVEYRCCKDENFGKKPTGEVEFKSVSYDVKASQNGLFTVESRFNTDWSFMNRIFSTVTTYLH